MKLTSYIHSIIDDVFIMSYFLSIPASIIEDCILNGTKIKNPLRIDKKPSAGFKYIRGKLVLTDYASPTHAGDVFNVAGVVLNLDCNLNTDFIIICNTIINKLIVDKQVFSTYKPTKALESKAFNSVDEGEKFTGITVEYANWDNTTFVYWYDFIRPNKELGKLLLLQLQYFDIYPIEKYWLNDNIRATKVVKPNEPMYAYFLKSDAQGRHYKLYMPNSKNKFVTNASDTLNYIDRIPNNRFAVLVKSIKDTVFLTIIAKYLGVDDVEFIPVNSESSILKDEDVKLLKKRYEKVFSFFDWDAIGVKNAFRNAVLHGIEPIFITGSSFNPRSMNLNDITFMLKGLNNEVNYKVTIRNFIDFIDIYKIKQYRTKDYSDYLKAYGIDKGIALFKAYYLAIKEREDTFAMTSQ